MRNRGLRLWAVVCGVMIGASAFGLKSSEAALQEDHLKFPVLVTLENGASASGFFVHRSDREYFFVTARHVFFADDKEGGDAAALKSAKAVLKSYPAESESDGWVILELDLDRLMRSGLVLRHPTRDVVAVKIGDIVDRAGSKRVELSDGVKRNPLSSKGFLVTVNLSSVKRFEEARVANDVLLFGYPVSLGIRRHPQIENDKPLLRKGIIAGKNLERGTLILDCQTFYGNSGAPILEIEKVSPNVTTYRLAGLVSQFIPYEETWYNLNHRYANVEIHNSGYSVAEPVDSILELLKSGGSSQAPSR